MDILLASVIAGLIRNEKAAETFLQLDYPLSIFYEERTIPEPHGQIEAGFIANCALNFYEKHGELTQWSYIEKRLKEKGAGVPKIKRYKKVCANIGKIKGIKLGEWKERLDSLLKNYREFRHIDLFHQVGRIYEKGCFGHYPDGTDCNECPMRKDCRLMVKSNENDKSKWVIDWSTAQTEQIKFDTKATHIRVYQIEPLLKQSIKRLDMDKGQLDENGNPKLIGIPTPWEHFTRHIGGWMPGRFYMFASRSGVGKSAALLQIANHSATNGHPTLLFNLEMPTEEELAYRALAYLCNAKFEDLMTKQVDDTVIEYLNHGIDEWLKKVKGAKNYRIIDIALQTKISTIFRHIDNYLATLDRKDLLVVIDYFGLLHIPPTINRPDLWWGSLAEQIHAFAKDRDIAIVSALQLNRLAEGAKRLTARHMRDSDKIMDNLDGFWGIIPISDTHVYIQGIKGRYFKVQDYTWKKELWRMGFVEHVAGANIDNDEDVML